MHLEMVKNMSKDLAIRSSVRKFITFIVQEKDKVIKLAMKMKVYGLFKNLLLNYLMWNKQQ